MANIKLPTAEAAEGSKGAMDQMSLEDGIDYKSVHKSDKGLDGVPNGILDLIEKDVIL